MLTLLEEDAAPSLKLGPLLIRQNNAVTFGMTVMHS